MTAARWARVTLAGPVAVVAALLVMLGMASWLPTGAAGLDNIVLPLVLLPLIWAALFFHACLDARLGRVALVALLLIAANGAMIAWALFHPAGVTKGARP